MASRLSIVGHSFDYDRFLDLEDWADSFAFPAIACSHGQF